MWLWHAFTYFMSEWRYAHNTQVLATVTRDDPMFHVLLENKYYLIDFGFTNRRV